MTKKYLGDGVYAEFDGFQVWIYTSNGVTESRKIALEPAVLAALNQFDAEMRRVVPAVTAAVNKFNTDVRNAMGGEPQHPAYGPGSITDPASYHDVHCAVFAGAGDTIDESVCNCHLRGQRK